MASSIYEKLKATKQLPSPTGVALQIMRLADTEDVAIDEIARVIESDPAISSKMLKMVNSPIAGAARPIASIRQAIALIGLRTVKSLALGFSLVSTNRTGLCKGFDYDGFWALSLGRAVACRHLAARLGEFAPDEAFTCGLLSRVGCLALATVQPQSYGVVLSTVLGDGRTELARREHEVFGIDHNELTAELMADWYLPELFRDAARAQEAPDSFFPEANTRSYRLARVLFMGGMIAELLTKSWSSSEDLATMSREAHRLGIAPPEFEADFNQVAESWTEAGGIFSIETSQVPSLDEIREEAERKRQAISRTNVAAAETEAPIQRWHN